MSRKYLKFILKYRFIAGAFVLIGTVFFFYELMNVRVHTNFFELYPPRHPFIKVYREFRKLFGTANLLMVVMESTEKDIYSVEFINRVDAVTRFLMDTKGVNPFQVLSLTHPSVRGFRARGFSIASVPIVESLPKSQSDLIEIKHNVEGNPGIKGFIVSHDSKMALVVVGLWEEELNFHYLDKRLRELREKFSDSHVKIHITGYPALYTWIHRYMPDVYKVFAFTALALLVLLFFFFGDSRGVVIPFSAGLISAIWGLGMAGVVGFAVDPLLLVVPLLLSARALSHSVQIMERYYEEYNLYENKISAIEGSFTPLIKPAVLSVLTDGIGILTIAVSGIPLMWKLAIYSSFWIISILVGVLTLSPVLLSFFPPPRREAFFVSRGIYDKVLQWHVGVIKNERRVKYLFVLFIILVVAGGFVGMKLKVGNVTPGSAILFEDHPYNVAMRKINKGFVGANRFVVIAEGDAPGAVKRIDNLKRIDTFARELKKRTDATTTLTLTQAVKRLYMLFREGDPNWEVLPYNERDVGAIAITLTQGRELQRMFDNQMQDATITLFYSDFSGDLIRKIVKEARSLSAKMSDDQLKFRLAGGLLGVLAAVNEEVERSYWLILFTVLSTTFVLVALFFRSLKVPLILVPPLLLAQFLSEAYMYLAGIDMNINSLPVAAVGIGIGIDYGIYVFSRLNEELNTGKPFLAAFEKTLMTTGKAVLFTASTLVVGVIFWIFTPLKFTSEMAVLLALLMFLNYEGAVIFVPVLAKVILRIKDQEVKP